LPSGLPTKPCKHLSPPMFQNMKKKKMKKKKKKKKKKKNFYDVFMYMTR
jgi:hypothetical protein